MPTSTYRGALPAKNNLFLFCEDLHASFEPFACVLYSREMLGLHAEQMLTLIVTSNKALKRCVLNLHSLSANWGQHSLPALNHSVINDSFCLISVWDSKFTCN